MGAAGQALIEKFQGPAQAKQNELAGQYKTQLANAQNQGKKAANGSFNSLIKQGNAAANKAIKNVNNKEAQNFLNQVSKLLNKQVQDGFKAAGIKPNQKIRTVAVNQYNKKVQPKINGAVKNAQSQVAAANKKW